MGNTELQQGISPHHVGLESQILPHHTTATTMDNQQNSPFLCLPAEIRNRIYTFVFRTPPILVCFTTSSITRPVDICPSSMSAKRRHSHIHYPRSNLSLIETCRQTCFETRLLPFELNTLQGFPEALLAALPGRLYYTQLTCITRIELMVTNADIAGRNYRRERERRGRLTKDTIDTICGLPRMKGLKVTANCEAVDDALWRQFTDGVAELIKQRQYTRTT
ncbi:hypothetical protein T440DRAFT_509882 [Plenodomus tracheiphilus IPT5]|uniref:Uncharacterized protein n=1 Tax=Plenodomus tracheiphilus IPT5 TaxID=1408161 RepID=A0A6A7B0B0_9PLEO|nr:hypothetical protein T440DRAFT_509882 [Plenodomus tracheiphilus IPT5]